VRPTDRLLDIGTDHARLPVYLMQRGLCTAATAADIAEGPLARAARTVKTHMLDEKITLIQSDGGSGLDPTAYDTVTITGMGGDTISAILEKSPWLWEKRLILQPQTRVSRFEEMVGRTAAQKITVSEGHRKYHIFFYEGAKCSQ